jgi:hypothetical protein
MLLAAVISQGALAAEPIPLEHFFRLPWAVQVQISPDASHISALVRTEARPDAFNLVVMPREGGTPRPITGYDDIDVAAHFWKGNRIVFMLVQGLDEATEHLRYDSMYSIGADGSDPRQLHGDRRNRGIQLSLIDLLRRTSGQILVGGQRSLDPVPQPYRLDVQSGKLEAVPIDEGLSAMAADTEGRVKLAREPCGWIHAGSSSAPNWKQRCPTESWS